MNGDLELYLDFFRSVPYLYYEKAFLQVNALKSPF